MMLKLQSHIVYGPVESRRLGTSLGINILPPNRKTCSFNCLYCQYGWTDFSLMDKGQAIFPTVSAVRREVTRALVDLNPKPAFITLSGNGESTLHPEFPEIVHVLNEVKNECSPESLTAILSNASAVGRLSVRSALEDLDTKILKLDAGDQDTLNRYNHPEKRLHLEIEEILEGLHRIEGVIIQSLFASGPRGNFMRPHLDKWLSAVTRINPSTVQIYSLDRPAPSPFIHKVSPEALSEIQQDLQERGIKAVVF
jgi:wyosine [tRNA(Phe)-imidazoG37] synthetase (radical SAM superfamily)